MQRRFNRNHTLGLKKGGELTMDESELEQQENEVRQNGETAMVFDGMSMNAIGVCTFCGKKSVCKCERCGDLYCSPLCQREDWHNHRFICFPMPRLVNVGLKMEIQNGGSNQDLPHLKADIKPVDVVKAESRQSYKARQLGSSALEPPLLKAGCCVILTGFTSSNRCYIRSANPAISEEYHKLLKKIDNFGRNSTVLGAIPEPFSFAVAKKDDKWCRVKILKTRLDNNQIRIHFVDIGCNSVVPLSELRKIAEDMITLPCLINLVQLHSIIGYSSEDNLLNKLSRFTGKEYKLQYVNNDETSGKIELYYWGTNNLLNSEIVKICRDSERDPKAASNNDIKPKVNGNMERREHKRASPSAAAAKDNFKSKIDAVEKSSSEIPAGAKPKDNFKSKIATVEKSSSEIPAARDKKRNLPPPPRQVQLQKPCLEPPFETILFDENGDNLIVRIVDNTYVSRGYIGCIPETHMANIPSIIQHLQNYDADDQPYTPKLNEYCLAQFEDEWYRAKVIEVCGSDSFQVVYIDFTNEKKLSSNDIRRYPMSLTTPCCTCICLIDGLPEELSDDLIEFLEQKCQIHQRLTVDSFKIMRDGVTIIELRELLKAMREKNLI